MLQINPVTITAGHVIGDRYRLESIIGEGGMGTVWEATDLTTKEVRALKVVRRDRAPDARNEARLLREARALSTIKHENVARLHEVGELDDGTPFFVMERLVGETLKQRLLRAERPGLDEALRIALAIATGVAAAHAAGIVHRDLKPDNVFLGKDGRIKVLDFGIAKEVHPEKADTESGLTTTGAMLGTLQYMAPEQVFGDTDVDQRADVWALGLVIYECLSGRRPTEGHGSGQVLKAIMTARFTRLDELVPSCPKVISELVEQMLSRDRAERPAMREVCRRLEAAVKKGDVGTTSTGALWIDTPLPERASARKKSRVLPAIAILAGAVAIGGIVFVSSRNETAPTATPPPSVPAPPPVSVAEPLPSPSSTASEGTADPAPPASTAKKPGQPRPPAMVATASKLAPSASAVAPPATASPSSDLPSLSPSRK